VQFETVRSEQLLDEAIEQAQTEVLLIHPGPVPPNAALRRGVTRSRALAGRGVGLRLLYHTPFSASGGSRRYLSDLVQLGAAVRHAPTLPLHLVLVDGATVLLPSDPEKPARGPAVVRDEVLVSSFAEMFEFCWRGAAEIGRAKRALTRLADLTDQHIAALRMMAVGMKDDRIARNLGVSPRTTSRLMGDLMTILQAKNRFQVGARAAELGLLK
jgi:DNA-binding CsgD family transcriptional regulator